MVWQGDQPFIRETLIKVINFVRKDRGACLLRSLCAVVAVLFFCGASESVPVQERYRFGEIQAGEVVSHTFAYKNETDYSIVVYQIVTSCGCLAVDHRGVTLQPGEQLEIPVEFHSKGFVGEVAKELEIMSSHQETPRVRLVLQGIVKPRFAVVPSKIHFDTIHASGTAKGRELIIQGKGSSLLRVKSLSRNIKLRKIEASDKHVRYEVSLVPPLLLGEMSAAISVSDKTGTSQYVIPVLANVLGKLGLDQPVLTFGVQTRTERRSKRVGLHYDGDVKDLKLASDSEEVTATILGNELEVVLTPISSTKRRFSSTVIISDSSGETTSLKITAHIRAAQAKNTSS